MSANLLEQRPLIERYLKEGPQSLSAFSFINIFAWKDFFDFEIKMIGGNFCIFASFAREARNQAGTFLYLPPLGKNLTPATIEACFAFMHENGGKANGAARIENVPYDYLNLFPEKQFKRIPKADEYGYFRKDLVALQGNDYKSKRSDYNYFTKHYKADYRPFCLQDTDECLALYDRWSRQRKEDDRSETYLYMLEDNRRVHQTVLKNHGLLDLVGRVVRVDGELMGYTFGYALNPDIFCVLFEIADLGFKGLPVYLFREFCNDPTVSGHAFINAMDDFALENIQKTKLSFRPKILFSSYTVTRQPY